MFRAERDGGWCLVGISPPMLAERICCRRALRVRSNPSFGTACPDRLRGRGAGPHSQTGAGGLVRPGDWLADGIAGVCRPISACWVHRANPHDLYMRTARAPRVWIRAG
jgi:hypothetical protein